MACDRRSFYYDPGQPSDLEGWITRRTTLRPDQARRAEALIATIRAQGATKYNLGGITSPRPKAAASSCPARWRMTPPSVPVRAKPARTSSC